MFSKYGTTAEMYNLPKLINVLVKAYNDVAHLSCLGNDHDQ